MRQPRQPAEDVRADTMLARLGLDPDIRQGFGDLLDALADVPGVPRRVLCLCRVRVAALHGMAPAAADSARVDDGDTEALRRGEFDAFDADERTALGLVDSLCFDPHAMTDAQAQRCADAFGPRGAVALMTAVAFADADCRLRRTLPASDPRC